MTLEELFSLGNLNAAFYETAKASHWKESTQRYEANLLLNNVQLRDEVLSGKYRVSPTVNFRLHERGKERFIESPVIKDRLVQKVITCKVLIPALRPLLIYDNYASLELRGTSLARKRMDVMLRRYMREHGTEGYILQIDIRKYFDNIDHAILKEMLHEKIHESAEIMWLIDYGVDSSSHTEKGLNLGSEEPQIFAIYYLSPVDNFIKIVKGVKFYGRYMDDMFIIHHDKSYLKDLLAEIDKQLAKLKLEVNKKKTHIVKLSHGFTYLQIKYNIAEGRILKRLVRAKITRERRRLKKFKQHGTLTGNDLQNCYKSWRNNIAKDCNASIRSMQSMDKLYEELFPKAKEPPPLKRTRLIEKIFKEAHHEDLRHGWQ